MGRGPDGGAGGGVARRFARRAALRLMRPYTAHQRQIDRELAAGLDNLAGEVAKARAATEAAATRDIHAEALLLAQLREQQRQLDVLAGLGEQVQRHADVLGGVELTPLDDGEPAPGSYRPAPPVPWTHEYNRAHAGFVAAELDDPMLLRRFRENAPLPASFGRGYDERVVEFPWVASRSLRGRLLDAGSTLNHLHVLARLRPRVDDLHIVTLAPEERSYPRMGVSYVYADLRELPFRDGTYDCVTSLSTLEHVGMDNSYYGSEPGSEGDPQQECLRAARELRRVIRSGGELYLTVPVGRGERFAWVRSFTVDELDELVAAFEPADSTVTYFRHDPGDGWQRATSDEIAGARYRDHFSSGAPSGDGVVAAEAVACVCLSTG